MNILSLDLATKTGWADTRGKSGVEDFSLHRGESPGMKWMKFDTWIIGQMACSLPNVVAYEQAHHRGGAATHSAHGFIAILEKVAFECGVEITNRHTGTIKKHATGKGNASKDEMLAAARLRWPDVEIIDDNQADALWLLDLVKKDLGVTNERQH